MASSNPSESDDQPPETRPAQSLPIESAGPTAEAFGCVVYFASQGGIFRGRVANLAGIEVTATDQRSMLGQIVAQFKSSIRQSLEQGDTPDWIDPPTEKHADEKKLFLPVHL